MTTKKLNVTVTKQKSQKTKKKTAKKEKKKGEKKQQPPKPTTASLYDKPSRNVAGMAQIEHLVKLEEAHLADVALSIVTGAYTLTPRNNQLLAQSVDPNWAETSFAAVYADLIRATRGEKSYFLTAPQFYADLRYAISPTRVVLNGRVHSYKFIDNKGADYPRTSPTNPATGLPYLAAPVDLLPNTSAQLVLTNLAVPAEVSEAVNVCSSVLWNAYASAGHRVHRFLVDPPSVYVNDASAFATTLSVPSQSDFYYGASTASNEVPAPWGGITRWLAALRLADNDVDRYTRFSVNVDYPPGSWMGDRILRRLTGAQGWNDVVILKTLNYTDIWVQFCSIFAQIPVAARQSDLSSQALYRGDRIEIPGQDLNIQAALRYLQHVVATFFVETQCVHSNVRFSSPITVFTPLPLAGQFQPPSPDLTAQMRCFQVVIENLRMLQPVTKSSPYGTAEAVYAVPVAIASDYVYYPVPTPGQGDNIEIAGWTETQPPLPWNQWSLSDGNGLALNYNSFGVEGETAFDNFQKVLNAVVQCNNFVTILPTFNTKNLGTGALTIITRAVVGDYQESQPRLTSGPYVVSYGVKPKKEAPKILTSRKPLPTAYRHVRSQLPPYSSTSKQGYKTNSEEALDPFPAALMTSASKFTETQMMLSGLVVPSERLYTDNFGSTFSAMLGRLAAKHDVKAVAGQPSAQLVSDLVRATAVSTVHAATYSGPPDELTAFFRKNTAQGKGGLIQVGSVAFAKMLQKKNMAGPNAQKNAEMWGGVAEDVFGLILGML